VKDLIILLKIKIYKMKNSRGFTLIELLVVIAIIGILSSVVLASLTTARTKGQDAAVTSQIASLRSQAELYYSSNSNSYTGFCENTTLAGNPSAIMAGITSQVPAFSKASETNCVASSTGWAVWAPLPSGVGGFCADSSGKSASSTGSTITSTGC